MKPLEELSAHKVCTSCNEPKPRTLEFFGPYKGRSIDGLRPICRECRRDYDRDWQKKARQNKKPA